MVLASRLAMMLVRQVVPVVESVDVGGSSGGGGSGGPVVGGGGFRGSTEGGCGLDGSRVGGGEPSSSDWNWLSRVSRGTVMKVLA